MPRNRLLDYLVYLVVRILIAVVQALRIETAAVGARLLGALFSSVLKVRARVIDDNLQHAFPQLDDAARREIARRMWEHLFLLVVEVAHAPRAIKETNWREFVEVAGKRQLVETLLDERPTVLVSGHYGNFEVAGHVLAVLGFPCYTIARPLDNVYLDRFLNDFRGTNGRRILPKNGSGHQISELLARGGILAFLGDQHAGPKGCWVDFFGRPASTHKAIALFSLANEAPLLYCYSRRLGRPLTQLMNTEAMVDPRTASEELKTVAGLTQWYTKQLEQTIREAPEQYWWVHRRWKDTRAKTSPKTRAA